MNFVYQMKLFCDYTHISHDCEVKEEQGWKQLLGINNSLWVCGWLIDCQQKNWLLLWVLMWSCDGVCGGSRTNKDDSVLLNDFSRWVSLPRLPLSVYQPIRVFQVSSSSYQNPLNSCSHTFHLVCLKPNAPRSCLQMAGLLIWSIVWVRDVNNNKDIVCHPESF